ncbi:hypothetical protein TNCV_2425291 [Trichonephila clavipes]|nr:hypothetical protein TNCV_2425291 [Trichonephila clavipes]
MPPDSGKITSETKIKLGICPQENILYDELNAEEHLLLFGRLKGIPDSELKSKGYRDDSESHRHAGSPITYIRAIVKRSREKEHKQPHIKRTENILLKGCTTTVVRNYKRKLSGRPDSGAA